MQKCFLFGISNGTIANDVCGKAFLCAIVNPIMGSTSDDALDGDIDTAHCKGLQSNKKTAVSESKRCP